MLIRPLPASEDEARDRLAALRFERRETYADLSRLLDRPDDYLAKWVRLGKPAILPEEDKRELARYFGIDAVELGVADEEIEPRPAYMKPPLRELAAR